MNKEKKTIGYLSCENPRDRKAWSGTHYRMLTSLEKEFSKVEVIGPFRLHFLISFLLKIKNVIHKIRFGKKYNRAHSIIRSKYYAKIIHKKIRNKKIDILFAPAAATEIAYLNTNIPICYLSDTSFNQIKNYYNSFSNISDKSIAEANSIEQKSIANSTWQVYPSKWAAQYAQSFYNAKNTNVIPFGANIDIAPSKKDILKSYKSDINILFLGVDWNRKGGDIVLDTITLLEKTHSNFNLTVCGCIPPEKHHKIKVIPFLDKNKEKDRITFNTILEKSHILFLPTRAEAYGIVFCEANAFGIPIITTDTGGVTTIVKNGINGYALPIEATAHEYAKQISILFDDIELLKKLSMQSRKQYDDELNWDIWGKKVKNLITSF